MEIIEAIVLGIVQGATEFLPISSSGHLTLVPGLLNLPTPDLTLSAFAHLGTLVAVIVYFWRDLWQIGRAVLRGLGQRQPLATPEARLGWYIFVGSIPAGAAGLLFEDYFESAFGNERAAAAFLLVTALLLLLGERLWAGDDRPDEHKAMTAMGWLDAIVIGLFQVLALFPGISRSGSTITGGLSRQLDRAAAARYSFLLGVPAIGGAGLLAVLDILEAGDLASQALFLATTFVSAAVVGFACIHFLLSWLRRRSLYPFAIYCALFGSGYLLVTTIWGPV